MSNSSYDIILYKPHIIIIEIIIITVLKGLFRFGTSILLFQPVLIVKGKRFCDPF